MPLYHKEVGIPAINLPKGKYRLDYGSHARQEATQDRFGEIELPEFLDADSAEVIEVEVERGIVQKILYRFKLDGQRDVCMPVIPRTGAMFVKTVWVNLRSDKHKTLDRSKYAKP